MKSKIFNPCMGLLAIVFLSSCTIAQVRPITIKVIDKETKAPMKNVQVYYAVKSWRYTPKVLFVIPNPDPSSWSTEVVERVYTDDSGVVSFGPRSLLLRRSEKIFGEYIYINLDVTEKDREAFFWIGKNNIRGTFWLLYTSGPRLKRGAVMNPMSAYRGYRICSSEWEYDPKEYGYGPGVMGDTLWNSWGLSKAEESFVVELEPWKN